jgi:hypothetical protein
MEEKGSLDKAQQASANMIVATLLNAHIATINSERQVVWLRYMAMLLTNALLYGSLMQLQAPTTLQTILAVGFGWALCLAWLVLTISSSRQFTLQLEAASRFARLQLATISEYANPMNIGQDPDPVLIGFQWRVLRKTRWQFCAMVFVIVLFMLAYASWLAHHLYYIFVFVEGPR